MHTEAHKVEMTPEKEFELKVINKKMPEWVTAEGRRLGHEAWLAIRNKTSLPRALVDKEIPHDFGPIATLAAAVSKSELYQEPKLEIHLTACPSYLDEIDWEKALIGSTQEFVYESINWMKVKVLADWVSQIWSADKEGKLIRGIYLHTPGPDDLDYASMYPGFFGIFSKPDGMYSCKKHWAQMESISGACNMSLVADVTYIKAVTSWMGVDLKTLMKRMERSKLNKFINSQYIHDAYIRWGQRAEDVLELFYVGSVVGYGNREVAFSIDNPDPLKLYINCEEGWSPETFAGAKTGLDLRHLFGEVGLHLALLISDHSIRTPWSGKTNYEHIK